MMMMIVTCYDNIHFGFSEEKEKERKKKFQGERRGELTKTLPVTKTIMSSVVSPWMSIEAISCLVGAWEIKF